jgi:5'-nucleotidase
VTTEQPIKALALADGRWAIEGTPADCVRLAYTHLATDFAWTLAGINHGGNLGADVYHSGTIAAVRESVLLGRPGIAFSQYRKRNREFDWQRASRWIRDVIGTLIEWPWEPGTFWNVNLPHLDANDADPKLVMSPLDHHPLPVAFREEAEGFVYEGNYHTRPRSAASDIDVCFGGAIAVTLLRL